MQNGGPTGTDARFSDEWVSAARGRRRTGRSPRHHALALQRHHRTAAPGEFRSGGIKIRSRLSLVIVPWANRATDGPNLAWGCFARKFRAREGGFAGALINRKVMLLLLSRNRGGEALISAPGAYM